MATSLLLACNGGQEEPEPERLPEEPSEEIKYMLSNDPPKDTFIIKGKVIDTAKNEASGDIDRILQRGDDRFVGKQQEILGHVDNIDKKTDSLDLKWKKIEAHYDSLDKNKRPY